MEGMERRTLERFPLHIQAKLTVKANGQPQNTFTLTTRDISSDGAFFQTLSPLPVGTDVTVELLLLAEMFQRVRPQNPAQISMAGKVLRTNGAGMAICFNDKYLIKPLAC